MSASLVSRQLKVVSKTEAVSWLLLITKQEENVFHHLGFM